MRQKTLSVTYKKVNKYDSPLVQNVALVVGYAHLW